MSELVTLSIIADFPNPYGRDVKKKHAAMLSRTDGHWAPDTDDFEKVAGQSATAKGSELVTVRNLRAFLDSLAFGQSPKNKNKRRPKRSVSRVDLISHGSVDGVALAGTIEPAKTDLGLADVWFNIGIPDQILDLKFFSKNSLHDIEKLLKKKETEEDPQTITTFGATEKGVQVDIQDCLQCFTENAKIVCYACHAAQKQSKFDISILQDMADLFEIEVAGFTDLIQYTYNEGKGISLSIIDDKLGQHGKSTFDYRDLDSVTDVFRSFKPKVRK
ncbi:hypothetical protein [Ktedonobacter racemifer]|uniref:Uncharacterized protein n=1 Tax=Ktedonobacter racemifer DSM 44963 TaxID=485913 RepID=D6TVF6_KTERA|nr:hypothetical protein [Ktedonobacter racemifer]EFH85359.1 hypothetical protein Krac_6565 [Ktedonobacter racemifer DSM 44963]